MNKILTTLSIASFLSVSGCGLFQANSPTNNTGKEVVSTMQIANSVLRATCASIASQTHDTVLANACELGYQSTADKLADVQAALDNQSETFVCAVALAESAMEDFGHVLQAKGEPLPVAVVTAEAVGKAIGASCTTANQSKPQSLGIKVP